MNRIHSHQLSVGFTLVELLVIVAVVGILGTIVIPNYVNSQARSNVAIVQNDLHSLASAMEIYYTDNLAYPPEYLNGAVLYSPTYPDPLRSVVSQSHLTTPVEYVSEIRYDVFLSRWDPPCYWYYNWLERYGRLFNFAEIGNPWYGESVAYGFWSLGPDLIPSGYISYDPTNGVVSGGDIPRMGPVIQGSLAY